MAERDGSSTPITHTCHPEGECFCVYEALATPRPEVEALQRILVCCDNGSDSLNKLAFIRGVAKKALDGNG